MVYCSPDTRIRRSIKYLICVSVRYNKQILDENSFSETLNKFFVAKFHKISQTWKLLNASFRSSHCLSEGIVSDICVQKTLGVWYREGQLYRFFLKSLTKETNVAYQKHHAASISMLQQYLSRMFFRRSGNHFRQYVGFWAVLDFNS